MKPRSICNHTINRLSLRSPFVFFIVLLSVQTSIAQPKTDITFKLLSDSIEKYMYKDLKITEKFIRQYKQKADKQDSLLYKGRALNLIGIYHKQLGHDQASLDTLIQALRIFETLKDTFHIAKSYSNIGATYSYRQQPKETLTYYEKALEMFTQIRDTSWMAKVIYNISTQKNALGLFQEDLKYKQKALALLRQKPDHHLSSMIQSNLAHSYYSIGKYKEAQAAIESYLQNPDYAEYKVERANALLTYALILGALKQHEKGIEACKESLKISEELGLEERAMKAYGYISFIYEDKGDYKNAFKNLEIYFRSYMEYFNKDKDNTIRDIVAKYDSEKKENEINLLQTQNLLKDTRLQKANQTKYALIGGLVLALILALLAWRLRNVKAKANAQLAEKNAVIAKALDEKNILLKEIHHRVKNNLQVISSLLKLQSQHIEDANAVRAIAEGRNRVHSMALLHQNLYQEENLTGVEMKAYFTQLLEGLFDAYNIRPGQIRMETAIQSVTLDIDTVIPIGLITNELVSNALKYAFPEDVTDAHLFIGLKEENNELILEVADNGVGYNPNVLSEKPVTFGQKLVRSLSEKLQADLVVSTENGTKVVMKIREYDKI